MALGLATSGRRRNILLRNQMRPTLIQLCIAEGWLKRGTPVVRDASQLSSSCVLQTGGGPQASCAGAIEVKSGSGVDAARRFLLSFFGGGAMEDSSDSRGCVCLCTHATMRFSASAGSMSLQRHHRHTSAACMRIQRVRTCRCRQLASRLRAVILL
jgi:hypothetical protein